MRKLGTAAAGIVAALALVAPAARAQAPQPRVTISGLVDQVTSWSKNLSIEDTNVGDKRDVEWYARTRMRPDLTAEIARTKFVLGLEIDTAWGQTGSADSAGNRFGTSGGYDLNTDVRTEIELKWGYTEITIPWLPWDTRVRLGAQPFATTYKPAVLATGDFAGVGVGMVASPDFKVHFAYAMIEEKGPGIKYGFNGEDLALVTSMEITPVKGLDLRPIYAYLFANGGTSTAARQARGGLDLASFVNGNHERRYTVGVDARWKIGSFYVDPTLLYQWGTREFTVAGGQRSQDRSAWLGDLRVGWEAGPLLLEGAVIYTSGNKASTDITKNGKDLRFYEPISTDTSFYSGWANIWALGVDYLNILNARASGLNPGQAIGYDKYGLMRLGARASYAVTPTFIPSAAVTANWTAEKVDTDGTISNSAGLTPVGKGDKRYLGTEVNLGFTWRFAPNVALDVVGAYMFAGSALESAAAPGPPGGAAPAAPRSDDAEDVATVAARVRFSF